MLVTARYGLHNTNTFDVQAGITLGQFLKLDNVRSDLGYSSADAVEGMIGGVTQSPSTPLQENMLVVVHDKACQKQVD